MDTQNQAPTDSGQGSGTLEELVPPETQSEPSKIMGKMQASWEIIKRSLDVLKMDKELLWIPVLSFATIMILLAAVAYIAFVFGFDRDFEKAIQYMKVEHHVNRAAFYGTLLIVYVISFFIQYYYESAIYIIVSARFQGMDKTLGDGFAGANNNVGKIFSWSVISATIGMILNLISEKSEWLGKIVISLVGAAWNIATFFSLPALVIGQKGVKDSFKESIEIMKKTWGETIIVNFGVGSVMSLVFILLILIGVLVMVMVPAILIPVAVVLAIAIILLAILSSLLSAIFKLALYEYARSGSLPAGFSSDLLKNAIQAKK